MYIGEFLKQYRKSHKLTMQNMADEIGCSKAYIGHLEKGVNPGNGKPIVPRIDFVRKVANMAGYTFDEFIRQLDPDQAISLEQATKAIHVTLDEHQLVTTYRKLSKAQQEAILAMIKTMHK